MERNRLARMALAALLPCVAMPASAKVAGPVALGVSRFADTEVSTNMAPPVRGDDPLVFGFDMDFSSSPSNCVEIAFGADADGDGTLAPEETGLVLGWDCGEWFVRSETAGIAETSAVPCGRQLLRVAARVRRDGGVASFDAAANGSPVFASATLPVTFCCAINMTEADRHKRKVKIFLIKMIK